MIEGIKVEDDMPTVMEVVTTQTIQTTSYYKITPETEEMINHIAKSLMEYNPRIEDVDKAHEYVKQLVPFRTVESRNEIEVDTLDFS